MIIWDTIRRFPGIRRRGGRADRPRTRRRNDFGTISNRSLRVEQFEQRMLLSITPLSPTDDFMLSHSVSIAVDRASDLDVYSEESLSETTQWVVGLSDHSDSAAKAALLGADYLGQTPYLPNTAVWEFAPETSWQTVADTLESADGLAFFYPLVKHELVPFFVPDDTLFADQWHLENTAQTGGMAGMDANVVPAWDLVTGDGVIIGIVDTGLQHAHPDLTNHYRADLSWDFNDRDPDPSPVDSFWSTDDHGTAVAGVAAAEGNNALGVSGSAPDAEWAGLRLISGWPTDLDMADALSYQNQDIDIYNNSWGSSTYLAASDPLAIAAIEDSVLNGRGGLGNIYVWAGGNEREEGGNVNYYSFGSSRYTIAVAAIDHNGVYSEYSNPGAALLVSGYSNSGALIETCGIVTTDRTGEDGYNATGTGEFWPDPLPDIDYTSTFGGTSSAAPLVSGVVALMLEANPDLTYRDVQHILVGTAEMNDPIDPDWAVNAAGYSVNHNYGFGAIDAHAAVQEATNWVTVLPEVSTGSGIIDVSMPIVDGDPTGVSSTVMLGDDVTDIEYVEVVFDAYHWYPGDLEVVLISPDGTESVLADPTDNWWGFSWDGYDQWTFTSARHWGESSEGSWTLEVRDLLAGSSGTWNSWELTAYGQHIEGGPGPGPDPGQTEIGPELIAVIPNQGEIIRDGDVVHIGPRELMFRFNDGQEIDPVTLDAIEIIRSGGDDIFGNANDQIAPYGWIGPGDRSNEVIVRFAETLPDDLYQITIVGSGDEPLMNVDGYPFHKGEDVTIEFDLDLGAQVIAVVPQPITRDAAGNLQQQCRTIEVYFNDDELDASSAENADFYRLTVTNDTDTTADDAVVPLSSVDYDPVANKAVLTFAGDLDLFGAGAFRLRIGNEYREINTSTTEAVQVGDSFDTAEHLGSLGDALTAESLIIASTIEPQRYDLEWPGAIDEPGHRELVSMLISEAHFLDGYDVADDQYGTATIKYNFRDDYGFDPFGNPLHNLITDIQKNRAREIMELYGTYLGIQVVETFPEPWETNSDFTIVTGDLRALDPNIDVGPGGTLGLAGGGVAIMDLSEDWGNSEYGEAWFDTAMHEIGHLLGFGHTFDMPPYTNMGSSEDPDYYIAISEEVFPGDHDIVHGRHLYRPDSIDVDLYEFTLESVGTFSAETVAERFEDSSLLDSALTLYDGDKHVIARNDDYYSEDSYIEVTLEPGTYYVAVSSTGNTQFDPHVAGSGLGGTTQGDYDLRLTFVPDVGEHMVDTTGTLLDGDADGVPGGVYDFWFNVQDSDHVLIVDKAPSLGVGAPGSLLNPYDNIPDAMAAAAPGDIVRIVGNWERTFVDQVAYDVGIEPYSVAVDDLDGDGLLDIVTANHLDDTVTVLFGVGDGTFWNRQDYDVGAEPHAVVLGDLNGDGSIDIVVANRMENPDGNDDDTISILLNNGDGTFQPQITRFVDDEPVALALGDLDGDGLLDIVTVSHAEDSVSVLLNLGGNFADQVPYVVGHQPIAVAIGDVNNDGAPDLVAANWADDTVSLLLGVGDGTFEDQQLLDVGDEPYSVAMADLQNDGAVDIVVSNRDDDTVSVLLGMGDGTFQAQAVYDVGDEPYSVALADIDDDGFQDIVTANRDDNTVSVLFGLPDGTFVVQVTYDVGNEPYSVALADVDGDIVPDIITANSGSNDVSVVLGRRDLAYEIGFDVLNQPLSDGWRMEIPQGVTVMIDAGAVFKLRGANIDVGSSAQGVDRSLGALQVLGTPEHDVTFSSFLDKSIGVDNAVFDLDAQRGDWGGLVFRNDLDYDAGRTVLETEGIFLNYVNHAEFRYGGGQVVVNSVRDTYNPIHMIEARPTVSFNTIIETAGAAMSADPNSFADTKFQDDAFTADYDRVGPDIHGNYLVDNSINGIFVRIRTDAGKAMDKLETVARWDDIDIVHVVAETLILRGTPGGPTEDHDTGELIARTDARLTIDPGVFVKLDASRIEAEISSQLIAEGRPGYPVVFTSLFDDRYGTGGTFDTTDDADATVATMGDWGGLFFGPVSQGSIDNVLIAHAGGVTPIEGRTALFNPVEIHQAFVRLTNSVLEDNDGNAVDDRNGRGTAEASVVFVRGAQPIIAGNIIRDNDAPAISINVNALQGVHLTDWGLSRGFTESFDAYPDNYGPLVRENRLENNSNINGLWVRGAVLTTEVVWDDTDIVHVLFDEVVVPNHHTYSGLRLQSSADESLVVKFAGANTGITALGTPQEIDDRIGGTLQIIGTPGFPVVLTSIADDSRGAGLDPWGMPQYNTYNPDRPAFSGDWSGVKFERYVNDRNVLVVNEAEKAHGLTEDANGLPTTAQMIGALAPHEKGGDDALRLGFDIHGFIRSDEPGDVDVYSFHAAAGTEIWIDIDRTTLGLDSIVELVDANGNVFARSDNSVEETANITDPFGLATTMDKDVWLVKDSYTVNPHDAGMRLILPGPQGQDRTYYVQVRSVDGQSSGGYQLQVRLGERQEYAGSIISLAGVHYATHAIQVLGLPTHSPLLAETTETAVDNNTFANAQDLGNLLDSDRGTIEVGGYLDDFDDIDWYTFTVDLDKIDGDGGVQWPVIFDIDYADGMGRPDTVLWVYDSAGTLIYTSDDSNVADDRPGPLEGSDISDLTRGTVGALDPLLGPVMLIEGNNETYYVAVTCYGQVSNALSQFLTRQEPIDSLIRIAEDQIGGEFGMSGIPASPTTILFPDAAPGPLNLHVDDYNLGDVVLFVTDGADLFTVDPFTGEMETDVTGIGVLLQDVVAWGASYGDLAMRNDGKLYTFTTNVGLGGNIDPFVGRYRRLDTGDGTLLHDRDDGIGTYMLDPADPTSIVPHGEGVHFEAMAHIPGDLQRRLLAVGHRDSGTFPATPENIELYRDNIMYMFDRDGNAIQLPGWTTDERLPSDIIPLGWLDTSVGTGGQITGMAFIGADLYAVDDAGGLYQVDNYMAPGFMPLDGDDVPPMVQLTGGPSLTFIADVGVSFTGLCVGPQNVEIDMDTGIAPYAEMLFATADDGSLYALDTAGDLQSVFLDGTSSIDIGTNATGLAFSNIDYNLWHVTNSRMADPGHGVNVSPDDARIPPIYDWPGNFSYWFGLEDHPGHPEAANYRDDNATVLDTYDLPGGAHGTLTTDLFSLADYEMADKPTVYVNYFLETEGSDLFGTLDSDRYDSARVFISNDGARWSLLASNIEADKLNDDNVVPLLDSTGSWVQAEMDLSAYAGMETLRLKFDFATAGTMQVGENNYAGAYLRAIPGNELIDGDTFIVDDNPDPAVVDDEVLFEFDMGFSLVAPNSAGQVIEDGEWFTLEDGNGNTVTFEYVKDGVVTPGNIPLYISDADPAFEIVRVTVDAINKAMIDGLLDNIVAYAKDNRIYLTNVVDVEQSVGAAMTLEGNRPGLANNGLALVAPDLGGQAIADGEWFEIDDGNGNTLTFEYMKDGAVTPGNIPIAISDADSAADIAQKTADIINFMVQAGLLDDITAYAEGDRVYLADVAGVQQSPGAAMVLEGEPGVVLVPIHAGMTAAEVAEQIGIAIDAEFSDDDNPDIFTSVKVGEDLLHMIYHTVLDPGKLGYWFFLPGDVLPMPFEPPPRFFTPERGQNNLFEGFYVDDVIVGFIERGEMITGVAQPDTTFSIIDHDFTITEGYYQLEIRKAPEFGTPLFRSWDTNDRDMSGITIDAPAAGDIVHGQTFTVSDGVHLQKFQFVDPTLGDADAEHLPITFTLGNTAATIGNRIVEAINGATEIDVTADSIVTAGRVDVFDAAWIDGLDLITFDNDGKNPTSVALEDLNDDGFLDLITGNSYDGTVSVLLGKPPAARANPVDFFFPRTIYEVGGGVSSVAVGDVDDNGILDIVTANALDHTVSVLLGDGDGTFKRQAASDTSTRLVFEVGRAPSSIVLADVDVDGFVDIVTANEQDDTVSLLWGLGNGTFATADTIDVGRRPMEVVVDDLDGNGMPDIITANSGDNTVSVLLEVGGGTFADPVNYDVGRMPVSVAIGNLDDDGVLDIVTADRVDGTVSILLGDGSGAFGQREVLDVNEGPVEVRIEDLNDDGAMDLVTANLEMDFVVLLLGNGDGTFAEPVTYDTDSGPTAVAFGDLNEDDLLEIVTANYWGDSSTVFVNLGGGAFFDFGAPPWAVGFPTLELLQGDQNLHRDQGQIIIEGVEIFDSLGYGIVVNAGVRDSGTANLAHPGSVAPLREINVERLVPGITVRNNLLARGGLGGIWFGGDPNPAGTPTAAVPFGRIVNNTIYGGAAVGIGIVVANNASPTILNNIFASLDTGVFVGATCGSTVLNTSLHQGNTLDLNGIEPGGYAMGLADDEPLFVDAANSNFYLAAGSRAIDSSLDSLEDRHEMVTIREPLGILESPILAPDTDLYGQLRSDDPGVAPPPGFGSNVFKDRGAIDRIDFLGPDATLIVPMDNGALDLDPAANDAFLLYEDLIRFEIQLYDTNGVGINDYSVVGSTVEVYRDYEGSGDTPLEQDKAYFFSYNTNTDVITLIPAAGIWAPNSVYTIFLNNTPDGIRDIADNPLRPNRIEGTTEIRIAVTYVDFGDTPDPTYPTLLESDGARHLLIGNYFLGEGVSAESDARYELDEDDNPIGDAGGDTFDDGVVFQSPLMSGADVDVTVTASRSGGVLDAWIDYNRDGDWDDPGEQVFGGTPLGAGENNLVIAVPAGLDPGTTFARFRFSSAGGLDPTGQAPDGEVEDYQVDVVEFYTDYGDAPDSYHTTRAEDGARHALGGSLFLGGTVDAELDGLPSPNALGDDLDGLIDDEDGVVFDDGWLLLGQTSGVTVTASQGGYLNAWIDYNRDGAWTADEKVFESRWLNAGPNVLSLAVPADAEPGATFARFRFSSQPVLDVTGVADDGEVEDYSIVLTTMPRDFGDAPDSYPTLTEGTLATATILLEGDNNDFAITATSPGRAYNDIDVIFVSRNIVGDYAVVTFDEGSSSLLIDIDRAATTGVTVIDAINLEGTFTAVLDTTEDLANDGSGLIDKLGAVGTTAGALDGMGADAAGHVLGMGLHLGASVDAELDAYPDAEALGDDLNALDDEDGVEWAGMLTPGQQTYVVVTATYTSAPTGYLNAWVDLNADGVWTAEEQVIFGEELIAGPNWLGLTIPMDVTLGTTFARFRFSSQQDLSFDGSAPDGEVEDYQVEIVAGTASISGVKFDDRDNDGRKDVNEDGLAGVTVYLDLNDNDVLDTDSHGNPIEPVTVTWEDDLSTTGVDETGYYEFLNLFGRPTPYIVREMVPSDWLQTYPNETIVLPDDSHANPDGSYSIFLEEDEVVADVDFGNYRLPHVTVAPGAIAEGHDGFTEVQLTATLTNSFGAPVVLHYETEDGTALLADSDYVSADGTITFPARQEPAGQWETSVLTSNSTNDYDYSVSGNYVVWEGHDGNDWEIYLFDGTYDANGDPVVQQLTDNDLDDRYAHVCKTDTGVHVVWSGDDGDDWEVFLYNGSGVIQLTDNGFDDRFAQVSVAHVTWLGEEVADAEIFLYDIEAGGLPVNVSDNTRADFNPQISGSNVVWAGMGAASIDIFLNDGVETRQVTSNRDNDREPRIDGNNVVWERETDAGYEIFLYQLDTKTTTQVTTNTQDDRYPQISGTDIVWQGYDWADWEIFHYNVLAKTPPANISNSFALDEQPQIHGDRVVWHAYTGWNWEVYFVQLRSSHGPANASSNAGYDWYPQVSEDFVAWRSFDGEDYEIVVATQAPPQVTETLTLRIVGDRNVEPDETFYVNFRADDPDLLILEDEDGNPAGDVLHVGVDILNDDGDLDYGDAPDPEYATLLANNGARHLIDEGFHLGELIDAETDGQPSATADRDDLRNSNDEDGVEFLTSLSQGAVAQLNVTASQEGMLDAWFDFNADGDWDDPGEQVFVSRALSAGGNFLTVPVPLDAAEDTTYARFRFSSTGGLNYTGMASDGEVEDYAVEIGGIPILVDRIVILDGTDGDDTFEFTAGYFLTIVVNGAEYQIPAADVDQIVFDGGAGNDTAVFNGSHVAETIEMWPGHAAFDGSTYVVDVENVESITARGGWSDMATLHDSPADDTFVATPEYGEIAGDGFFLRAVSFGAVTAVADQGGVDQARLYDSAGDDTFDATPEYGQMTGGTFVRRAESFEFVYGVADNSGTDVANLYDSPGDDTFIARPEYATMTGQGFSLRADGFEFAKGYAGAGGTDVANLYDSAGDDTFSSTPEYAKMANGDGLYLLARNFRYSKGYATAGGTDVAIMTDSAGNDTFIATPTYAKFVGENFYNRADFFEYVKAYGKMGGDDVANLHDSPGNDTFVAGPRYGKMYGDGFYIRADFFRWVTGYGNNGGEDVAELFDSAGDDNLVVTPIYGKLYSDTFYNRAYAFETVNARASAGGYDVANLFDSALSDLLEADDTWARLSNVQLDFSYWADQFDRVNAYSSNVGDKKDVAESVDFLFAEGMWEDI